ncbi:PAS domain-containing sensor histidine kinase [Propionispora hippei]|uniref:histidine kinase n=1 Tax=Propionispora hippei DSM 15287 TaxID=1123003 RepID=A0A1M6NTE5_9FIRM|nr:ATP-binding protein [Propionispora hippei]SHJ98976.1 Histidine kinase-, DNA gyrase B-, and HSP90-like ATPase [Propionispora hippei DSM 15287]
MLLDIKTLLIASAAEAMVASLILALACYSERQLRTVIRLWSISQALIGAGMLLIALQGIVPVLWGVGISNMCIALGFTIEQEGISRYIGKQGYLRSAMLAPVLVICFGIWFFSVVYASLAYRIIAFSVGAMLFSLISVATLLKSGATGEAPIRFLVAAHLQHFAVMGARAVNAYIQSPMVAFLNIYGMQAVFVLLLSLCGISRVVCYFWLIIHRLGKEARKQEEELNRAVNTKKEILERMVDEKTRNLRASEAKVRALINAIPDMLVVSTGEGRVEEVYSNSSAFSARFPRQVYIGQMIQQVLPRVNANEIVQLTQNAIINGQSSQYEFILPWKEESLYLHTRILPLNASQAFHVVTDITEQKKLEAEALAALTQLQEAQKLSTAGVMAASIVHDLGQPLNSLKISTDGLLYVSEMGEKLNMDQVKVELRRISRQVERVEAVVTNVRNIVRQDSQSRRGVVLDTVLHRSLETFRTVQGSGAVALQYQTQAPHVVVCAADSEIEQILFNLLRNAQEAVLATSKQDKRILISTVEKGEWLELVVSDNGCGIAEDILPKVFEPFFTTKRQKTDNLGFGLAIVKSLVENLRGNVTVYNNELGGADFVIRLPIEKQEENQP